MKVLAIHNWTSGVNEARMWMPARALQKAGHEVTYWPGLDGSVWAHLHENGGVEKWLDDNVKGHDVIWAQYTDDIDALKLLLSCREVFDIPLVVDLDDDPFNLPTYNLAFRRYHPASQARQVVRMLLNSAECVTTSTAPLQDVLKKHCRRTFITPNLVDTTQWEGLPVDPTRHLDEGVRVMFAGGQGRYGDLGVVHEAVEWAMGKFPQLRLVWVGCAPDWAEQWMMDKEDPKANRSFFIQGSNAEVYKNCLHWVQPDILINPIVDNKFNESKSCLKAWEAAMVGACYMGSDTLTHAPLANDVMLKCATTYQWKESLEAVIVDKELRQRLAKRLYDHAIKDWAVGGHTWRWLEAFQWAQANRVRAASDYVGLTPAPVAQAGT